MYIFNCILCFFWSCDWLFEMKVAATASLFLSEGGCGENGEWRAGDLWPRGRLISAVTSPDVRLAVSPSQLITFAHTHMQPYGSTHSYTYIQTLLSPPGLS